MLNDECGKGSVLLSFIILHSAFIICLRWLLLLHLRQHPFHKGAGFFEGVKGRALAADDMFDPPLNIGRVERRALP